MSVHLRFPETIDRNLVRVLLSLGNETTQSGEDGRRVVHAAMLQARERRAQGGLAVLLLWQPGVSDLARDSLRY